MVRTDSSSQEPWVFNRNSNNHAIIRELASGIDSRIFIGKDSMLSFVTIKAHTQGSVHRHPEEQWGILLEGECIRMQNDTEVKMKEGDFWYSPPNVLHAIRTEDKPALVLDIFSPPRPAYRSVGQGFDSKGEP